MCGCVYILLAQVARRIDSPASRLLPSLCALPCSTRGDLYAVRTNALACLNELVTDALTLVPDCLDYMRQIKHPEVFRFCAIPQVRALIPRRHERWPFVLRTLFSGLFVSYIRIEVIGGSTSYREGTAAVYIHMFLYIMLLFSRCCNEDTLLVVNQSGDGHRHARRDIRQPGGFPRCCQDPEGAGVPHDPGERRFGRHLSLVQQVGWIHRSAHTPVRPVRRSHRRNLQDCVGVYKSDWQGPSLEHRRLRGLFGASYYGVGLLVPKVRLCYVAHTRRFIGIPDTKNAGAYILWKAFWHTW